jgi:YD repeat-containing protein
MKRPISVQKHQIKMVLLMFCVLHQFCHAQTYNYDLSGRLTRAVYPNGRQVSYSYDAAGNILSVSANGLGVDTNRPVAAVVTPAAGGTVVSNNITLAGTAKDNAGVAAVYLSVNNSDWTQATTANGWSNWTAQASLVPGTNVVAAYSVDGSGNISPTNQIRFFYAVSAVLELGISGRGTVSPNYSNAVLQIGRSYSISAIGGTGFGFTNWTGTVDGIVAINTNKAALNFVMQSNLALSATFVDVMKPTLNITNIPPTGKVSNELFTIKGRAGDNVGVASVLYNVINTGWTPADSGNNFTNWSGDVDLTPGPNVIVVTAADAAGNSLTITSRVTYVLSAPLLVQTNLPGWGMIVPGYNNALLQISNKYMMTATAKPGFAFTNWTDCDGNVITNKPALNFVMASNLCFRANFMDTQKPTAVIVSPAATTIPAGEFFSATGKATDNVAVAGVWCQLNSGVWFQPNTGNGWSNWNVTLDLVPGTNRFSAYAVDISGNVSPTNVVKFIYSTALANLNGLAAVVSLDNIPADTGVVYIGFAPGTFGVAFGATTFSQVAVDDTADSAVGKYTYTRQSPTNGQLRLTYTAPPSMTNSGTEIIRLDFSTPHDARLTNVFLGYGGGIVFTSTPTLVPSSLQNLTVVFADQGGTGGSTRFTNGQALNMDLSAQTIYAKRSYTYAVYSPIGALIRQTGSNFVAYSMVTMLDTNFGIITTAGNDTSADTGVFGVASQQPGGNAPISLVNRNPVVIPDLNSFRLMFPDAVNFTQTDTFDETTVLGAGTYNYNQVDTNTGSLDLNFTSPEVTNTSAVLRFVSPNFATFTNADGTLGAAVWK